VGRSRVGGGVASVGKSHIGGSARRSAIRVCAIGGGTMAGMRKSRVEDSARWSAA
jgi:hypothetical protein